MTIIDEIIEMAVQKEVEAAMLYTSLKKQIKDEKANIMLDNLAQMENGHADTLRKFQKEKDFSSFDETRVDLEHVKEELSLSEEDLPLNDTEKVIRRAIKNEIEAFELYNRLANTLKSVGEAQTIFTQLANEEKKHREQLEELLEGG